MYYPIACMKRNNNLSNFYTLLTDLKIKSSILYNNKMCKLNSTSLRHYCSMPSKKCTRPVTAQNLMPILLLTHIKSIKTQLLMVQNNSSNLLTSLSFKEAQGKSQNPNSAAAHTQKYLPVQRYKKQKENQLIMKCMWFISCTQWKTNHQ